ncbi:hypothetical protein ACFYZI_32140 [Streptomyces griseorubiginosus]|jgi:hypothetical protein|uniref:hypothetical protein n=1 Tax=Streptomyces TaxID=1883 RepID=UPI00104774F2|nr:hypothetical protein [Streptomyces sp. BK205]TCR26251.1 hypothetical protein EV578_101198 [Streptomyces sp. BK205]
MTPRKTGAVDPVAGPVGVRAEGDVHEQELAYIRAKVRAALDRPGLPTAIGEVRISRATAHHAGQPWTAGGEIRVGRDVVVVHAREASAHELAARLQDRLRGQVERLTHRADAARRGAEPPPWRGGGAGERQG